LVLAIIAFACEFVAIRNKRQPVTAVTEVCGEENENCTIEDHENDSEASTEHQAAVEVTEVGQRTKVIQQNEDSESEEVTVGRNMITIVAEVHSHDESNIQAESQADVAESLNPLHGQQQSNTFGDALEVITIIDQHNF